MKAWQVSRFGAPREALTLAELPEPRPGPGEVLIRVRAVSLNYRDLLNAAAARPGHLPLPFIPCSDGAGEIVALGEQVSGWRVGDRVAGIFFPEWQDGPFQMAYHQAALGGSAPGLLAEWAVLPAHALVLIPEHLSYLQAACLPCAAVTAWQALVRRGGLQPGQTILTLGTGGVSIFALQLARAHGAQVIITSSSDEKLERARALGATHGLNYRTIPEWSREVWRLTERRGVDQVVEVGGPGTLGQSLAAVAAGGQIALIGVLTGFAPPATSLFPLVGKNARLDGIYVGSRADFEALNAFLSQHRIEPIIDRTFAFEEAAEAFAYLESGAHFGKIALSV